MLKVNKLIELIQFQFVVERKQMKRLLIRLLVKVIKLTRESEYKIGKLLRTLDRNQSDLCCNFTEKIFVIISKLERNK